MRFSFQSFKKVRIWLNGNSFSDLRSLINTMQKVYSFACLCEPAKNKLIRLNKTALYNEEFVNAGIIDCGCLINSTGKLVDYDRVANKIDIPKLCGAISPC